MDRLLGHGCKLLAGSPEDVGPGHTPPAHIPDHTADLGHEVGLAFAGRNGWGNPGADASGADFQSKMAALFQKLDSEANLENCGSPA